jgi:hypothetical protein
MRMSQIAISSTKILKIWFGKSRCFVLVKRFKTPTSQAMVRGSNKP